MILISEWAEAFRNTNKKYRNVLREWANEGYQILTKEFVLHFHRQLLSEYGGRPGLRDEGLLESALYKRK